MEGVLRYFTLALLVIGFMCGITIRPLLALNTATKAPSAPSIYKSDPKAHTFGHPLVPGGIHTANELAIAARFYPGLDIKAVSFTLTKKGVFAYVAYMKNGQIYWTRHPRYIPAGEPIVTDGHIYILQRCGNLIRFDDPAPVETLFNEPSDLYPPDTVPGDVSPFIPTPTQTTSYTSTVAPSIASSTAASQVLPGISPSGFPTASVPSIVVTNVPEPRTDILVLFGILMLLFILVIHREV